MTSVQTNALNQTEIKQNEERYSSGVYTKRDLIIVRGEGARLWDAAGREYIDCVGGQGAANVGHANPAIVQAITAQASRLLSCPEFFYNDTRAAYLEALTKVLPEGLERLFLCNSGAEALEAALKFARLLTGRTQIIATMRGFHGRTMGALSATWNKHYREPFLPLVPDFRHIAYNNIAALETAVTERTAAVLVELVQGEGGVHPATAEYVQALRRITTERGALLILDEVQTGFGRTGTMFACEGYGITPDLLAMAKSIGGGMPMGAVGIHGRFGPLPRAIHGSTFGGNPLSCAAGLAALTFIRENDLPAQAASKGAYLMKCLQEINSPLVREVRGKGLLIGFELKEKVGPHLQALAEDGILALNAGPNVLRLLPPLVIEQQQLDSVVEAVARTLAVSRRDTGATSED